MHDLGDRPAVAIIKHANPCGVASHDDLATAYRLALECDERSAFGGIVALNRPIDDATVGADGRRPAGRRRDRARLRTAASLDALKKKRKNTRILEAPAPGAPTRDVRQISGGFLVQDAAALRVDARRVAGRHQGRRRPPSSGRTSSWRGGSAGT